MADWSIAKRINAITLALMGALVLVGVMGVVATLRIAALFNDYRASSAQIHMAFDIAEDLYEAELGETRYRTDPSEENVAIVLSNLEEVVAVEAELLASLRGDTELFALAEGLPTQIARYQAAFATILDLQAERDVHVTQLTDLGAETQRKINATQATMLFDGNQRAVNGLSDGRQEFLLARVFVERFLLTNTEEDFIIAEEHLGHALSKMADAERVVDNPNRVAAMAELQSMIAAYRDASRAAREAIIARNALRSELNDLSVSLANNIEVIVETVVDRQGILGVSGDRTRILTLVLLCAFVLGALVASYMLAQAIAARISRAIAASVDQMGALADGDLDIEILGTEQTHELGQMARALQVFRENGREARDLAEKQREQEAEARRREAARAEQEAAEEAERNRKVEEARRAMIRELSDSVGVVVDAGARGDFSQRIEAQFDEAELAALAHSINSLIENVESGVAETARVMSRIAAGDLTDRMDGDFMGTFADLKANVNETIDTLGTLVVRISGQCGSLSGAAGQMTDQAHELARRAEQQAASLEETSAAMEQISASARSSAEGASNAAEFARDASVRVDDAGQVVAAAVNAMSDIRNASERINEIVAVIDGIAFQTNLLALNASVEAARAGSAGKGFAVVATEVRALAQRSGEASKDIKGLIDESAEQVRKGVDLVQKTGTTLEEIMGGVGQMAATMQELTTTAREQATGVAEVTSAITQLDTITQRNAALSETSRETAAQVKGESDGMRELISAFRTRDAALQDTEARHPGIAAE